MHNLKEIRKDFNNFKKSLEKRSIEIDISNLEKLDKNRELIQKRIFRARKKKYPNLKINHCLKNQKNYLKILMRLQKSKKN